MRARWRLARPHGNGSPEVVDERFQAVQVAVRDVDPEVPGQLGLLCGMPYVAQDLVVGAATVAGNSDLVMKILGAIERDLGAVQSRRRELGCEGGFEENAVGDHVCVDQVHVAHGVKEVEGSRRVEERLTAEDEQAGLREAVGPHLAFHEGNDVLDALGIQHFVGYPRWCVAALWGEFEVLEAVVATEVASCGGQHGNGVGIAGGSAEEALCVEGVQCLRNEDVSS